MATSYGTSAPRGTEGAALSVNLYSRSRRRRRSSRSGEERRALTSSAGSFIFLVMSSAHAPARAAIELALIGVTPLCVADIICR